MQAAPKNSSLPVIHPRARLALISGLLAVAAFVVFLPALNDGFVYDDHVDVRQVDNVFIPGAWPALFYTASAQLYRPIKYISYYVDNVLWGWKPMGWHLQSLLWHSLNSVLAFCLIRRLKASTTAAAIGALWFAVHPIHAEAVVWISSRASLLSTAFVIGCVLAWLRWRETESNVNLLWLGVCGFFGFFSKEDALMVIPILLTCELWLHPGVRLKDLSRQRIVIPIAMLGLIAFIYLLLRQSILVGLQQGRWEAGLTGLLATLPVILTTYGCQLIYPGTMAVDQPVDYSAGFGPAFWLSVSVLLMAVFPCFLPGNRWPRWKFCAAWFFLSLLPVMGLIPINQPRADRFLYLPSLAGAFLIAFAVDRLRHCPPAWQKAIGLAYTGLILVFAGYAFTYSQIWKDEETLWLHTVKVNPRSYRAFANLAAASNNRGHPQQGLQLIDQSLAIRPAYPEGFIIKGYSLDALGKATEAEAFYRKALTSDPNNTLWLFLLANHLERVGRLAEAEQGYERSVELRPGFIDARLAAALLAVKMNHPEKAVAHWRAILQLDPHNETAHYNLAIVLKASKNK